MPLKRDFNVFLMMGVLWKTILIQMALSDGKMNTNFRKQVWFCVLEKLNTMIFELYWF